MQYIFNIRIQYFNGTKTITEKVIAETEIDAREILADKYCECADMITGCELITE